MTTDELNMYKILSSEEGEDHIKRLMVEIARLNEVAFTHFREFLSKHEKALTVETPEHAITLYRSAMNDAIACQTLMQTMLSAILGSAKSAEDVHEAFARFANGKPN